MNITCNVAQMKRAISLFKDFNEEVLFDFKPEGLRVWTRDVSTIMLIDMYADKSSFIAYNCVEPRLLCINSHDLYKAFSRIMDDDFLFISIPEKGNTVILNIMKRDNKIKRNREFILPILETQLKITDVKVELPNSFTISSLLFKTALIDMGTSSGDYKGSVIINVTKDRIKFSAGSVGEVKSKVEYYKSELRGLNLVQDSINAECNLKYMYDFFKQIPDDMFLNFNMDVNRPIKCQFEISDAKLSVLSDTKPFKFSYFIAPFVSEQPVSRQDDEEGGLEVGGVFESPELDKLQEATKAKEEKKEEVK